MAQVTDDCFESGGRLWPAPSAFRSRHMPCVSRTCRRKRDDLDIDF